MSDSTTPEAQSTYIVVVNDEEQYSIWPADRTLPAEWRGVGKEGTKPECLDYIESVWVNMRPLSLRRALEDPVTGGQSQVSADRNA